MNLGLAALITLSAVPASAQDETVLEQWQQNHMQIFDAADVTLAELQWLARPLVVFADTPNDPRFTQQIDLLADRPEDLGERDVIIIVDTDPAAMTDLRTKLRPRGFMLALLGKDGRVALRKPAPYSIRELSRSIDKMPLRQQEIEDRRRVTP
ncbi:DUF4174 domain-containing protein [Yoonia sediminilitoris]|uniref:Uncharacterized protein DUF4174 n=1 Tax=Yoonia sediminilitoris TaxID=1286148 RepID=A0A2T6KQ39_9RHOB|nr:DUF4174 domain-containing protein [Yoonia sediminilitoris]PUB18673.1 uncharacterized protein DUF4174 [Yoonia sediminilitoris]RCW98841.1 uncharacterized protein DUF4174 [Yoonia sediminilitoris]